jgi:hypothetical protein
MQNHFITQDQVKDGKYIGPNITTGCHIIEVDKAIGWIKFDCDVTCNSFYSEADIEINGNLKVVELFCRSIKANDIISLEDHYREAKIIIKNGCTENKVNNIVGNFIILIDCNNIIAVNIECKSLKCNFITAQSVICKNQIECYNIKANQLKAEILFTKTTPDIITNYCSAMMVRRGFDFSKDTKKAIFDYVNK